MKKTNFLNTGFTLVETLVAVSIFSVAILALMSVLASGISNANYAKRKMAATYLAQEGIEYARNVRDTSVLFHNGGAQAGWSVFRSFSDADIAPPAPSDTSFTRTVYKTPGVSPDEVKIYSRVEWTQASGDYSITFSENLFNWVE